MATFIPPHHINDIDPTDERIKSDLLESQEEEETLSVDDNSYFQKWASIIGEKKKKFSPRRLSAFLNAELAKPKAFEICETCSSEFSPQDNHDKACRFHPRIAVYDPTIKKYTFACCNQSFTAKSGAIHGCQTRPHRAIHPFVKLKLYQSKGLTEVQAHNLLNQAFPNVYRLYNMSRQSQSGRQHQLLLQKTRQQLPIYSAKSSFLELIGKHRSLIIVGETGSGKTTQIPQYLLEHGYCAHGRIAVTQPRRVAAITVARRVCDEVNRGSLGDTVGYTIRFDDCSSSQTKIQYLTDGMLLRQTMIDPYLKKYSVVVIDEAHERTVHTDVLLGILKTLQKKRSHLKLIIMSATLEAEHFAKFFSAEILRIPGRMFPVEILYTQAPERDFLEAALITILQIHMDPEYAPPGDILVFLTGQEDIETLHQLILEKTRAFPSDLAPLIPCRIYAALHPSLQLKVFESTPIGSRKVILATNIAETSITINGVKYVIDTGLAKKRQFSVKTAMDILAVMPCSKAEVWQRSGRAGREQPGQCYRLFTPTQYDELRETTVPEILRCNLASTVLQLKALRVVDVLTFEFLDRPSQPALMKALDQLLILGALTDQGSLSTPLGTQMAQMPLEPMYSKFLISASSMGCCEQALSIVAMLSVDTIFTAPSSKKKEAEAAKRRLAIAEGDHLTLLNVFNQFMDSKSRKEWCNQHYINFRSLKKATDIRKQLRDILLSQKLTVSSSGNDMDLVRRALVTGLFLNAARKHPDGNYRTIMNNQPVWIHPSSVLFGSPPDCVLYSELIVTSRQYMRDVTMINLEWLPELASRAYRIKQPTTTTRDNTPKKEEVRKPTRW